METKCCTKCGEHKPATTEYFPKHYDGLFSWCKLCKRAYQLIHNKTESGRASQKKYEQTPKGKKTNFKGTQKYVRKTKGIYAIFDNQDNCLYIGRSSQFNGRIIAHKHAVNNLEQAAKHRKSMLHLYEELAQYDYISFRLLGEYPKEELVEQEQYYIRLYNPLYNKNSK